LALTMHKQTLGTGDFKVKVSGMTEDSTYVRDVEQYSFSIK
jgi:hypothetical protein